MNSPVDPGARQALRKKPPERTPEDLNIIYSYLHGMEILSNLREHQLRLMSTRARYERYSGNQMLFCSETIARCWYILLSGSVLVKDSMVLPPCSFGKQFGGKRGCDCLVLEPSEMIVVENSKDNEDSILQREIPARQSRRRFRKINYKGERQTIIDGVDINNYLSGFVCGNGQYGEGAHSCNSTVCLGAEAGRFQDSLSSTLPQRSGCDPQLLLHCHAPCHDENGLSLRGGNFSVETPSSQMTPACIKLTQARQYSLLSHTGPCNTCVTLQNN